MKVYLDNAATAPIKKEVLESMRPYLEKHFGNPSSIHEWGRIARKAVDEAREKVAGFSGAELSEIVFTSGGSEADNLAIKGLVNQYWENRNRLEENGKQLGKQKTEKGKTNFQFPISKPISNFYQPFSPPHIITSQFEHHAVSKTCEELEKEGLAEVTYLKPNREGIIEVENVRQVIKANTVLVSIMYVNNEIGTIQPIREIGKMIESENRNRLKESGKQLGKQKVENSETTDFQSPISKPISNFHQPISRIFFHSDAVQAAEYLPMNVDYLHVDLLTISGHKVGAPKGVGALYIKKGTPIASIIHGGEQELGLRAGTENVAGIVALGKACEIIRKRPPVVGSRVTNLRDYFITEVLKEIPEVYLNGSQNQGTPHIINFYFKHIEGESIVISMDLAGIACSTGSACTSQSLEPSHVIMAVYNDAKRAAGSVRFSLSENTTKEEIEYTAQQLKKVVQRLRKISPYGKKYGN